jgi:hypothetical protein
VSKTYLKISKLQTKIGFFREHLFKQQKNSIIYTLREIYFGLNMYLCADSSDYVKISIYFAEPHFSQFHL